MNGFELNIPIRIYWDLFSPDDEPLLLSLDYDAICRDILALKILSLNLTDLGPVVSPSCLRILQQLQGKGPAVTLTVTPEALTPSVRGQLQDAGVRVLLVKLDSLRELDACRHLVSPPSSPPAGLSFEVGAETWRELPDLIAWCAGNGIPFLSLPMQRLLNGETPFHLKPEEKIELSARLRAVCVPPELKLTIHDPFLWKAVHPSIPFPDGGCQAANTMLAISPAGIVYPCPSFPAPLGNLAITSLREVVLSTAKKEMRRQILSSPVPCASCADLPVCKGGCRGRALAAHGLLDAPDPGCLS